MRKPKTVIEVQLVQTNLAGRITTWRSKDLEKAFKDAEWYETDPLGRTVIVQTREVTTTPWVAVTEKVEAEFEPKFAVHIGAGVFHVWKDGDTLCRMWSTGGLNRDNYRFTDDAPAKKMCMMCSNRQGGD